MASVRVRRYTVLGPENPEVPRGLASIFMPAIRLTPVSSQPTDAESRPEGPSTVTDEPANGVGLRPPARSRAYSRVSEHCMNLSLQSRHLDTHNSLPDLREASNQPSPPRDAHFATERPRPTSTIRPRERSWVLDTRDDVHPDGVVEHLDCIDPQVATMSSLTNAANAIVIPPLSFYSRKPMLVLPDIESEKDSEGGQQHEDPLDRYVDDVLKRPSIFKRTMQGVWSFLKTPLGIITGIYAFLVVFWGSAIVLFLTKAINLHDENAQGFWVEVSAQIENGLFTVTGIGLLPVRVIATYRICKIWYYKRRSAKLRAKAGLPQLYDVDDLPDPIYDPNYVHVLNDKEQLDLHKQQAKFREQQAWYRPHGTETHRAFPINVALLICLLIDGNSICQILLCYVMWGLNRFERPPWTVGTLIPCACLLGVAAAVYIWRGGKKTKRTKEVQEALQRVLMTKGGCAKVAAIIGVSTGLPTTTPDAAENPSQKEEGSAKHAV